MVPNAPPRGQFLKISFWFGGFCLFWFIILAFGVRWSTQYVQMWTVIPFLPLPVLLLFPASMWLHNTITTVDTLCKQFLSGAVLVYGCVFLVWFVWVLFLGFILAFMGLQDTYNMKTGSVNSLGECLLGALVTRPIPQAVVAFFAILYSKRAGEDNKNFPVNALYVGAGYSVSRVFFRIQEAVFLSGTVGAFRWSVLVPLTMTLLTLEAPVQMLACYAAGLLAEADATAGRPINKFRCVAVGWLVRAAYFLVRFPWESQILDWWVFVPIAAFEFMLLGLWLVRQETKGHLFHHHGPSGAFGYNMQGEEMGEYPAPPALNVSMLGSILPPGVAVGIPCGVAPPPPPPQQPPGAHHQCQAV
eukprot:EG_transcript_12916